MEIVVKKCIEALEAGNKLIFCGNGGSAELSNHIAAEFVVKFGAPRHAFDAISLCANMAVITACANDFGYEQVFSRQVEAHGRAGDILFCISTSGKSENVLLACETAKKLGITTVAMTGDFECALNESADFALLATGETITAKIQEVQLKMAHELVALVENGLEERDQIFSKLQSGKAGKLKSFVDARI